MQRKQGFLLAGMLPNVGIVMLDISQVPLELFLLTLDVEKLHMHGPEGDGEVGKVQPRLPFRQ